MQGKAMLMPAVWGGVTIGVLSALPVVSIGNLCCCLWIVTGGAVAAYLLQNNTEQPIELGDGALVGLLAGLFGAVAHAILSLPLSILLGPIQQRLFRQIVESAADIPDNVRQVFDRMGTAGFTLIGALIGFVMMLVLGVIFASLGGLFGAVFFKKKPLVPAEPKGG
jgi:hypothetical protein